MKKLLLGLTLLATLTACPGGGGGTGSATLNFTNAANGYNGSAAILSGTTTLAGVIMGVSVGSGTSKRALEAFLPTNSREEGVTYDLNTVNGAGVIYSEGDSSTGKIWTSTGGSIRVVRKSGKTLTFELINVTLGKKASNTTASAGTITVNGTISGESITPL